MGSADSETLKDLSEKAQGNFWQAILVANPNISTRFGTR
jgi:hypothetical protein